MILGQIRIQSWFLAQLFNSYDISQKESHPILNLSYPKMPGILQVKFSIVLDAFYNENPNFSIKIAGL